MNDVSCANCGAKDATYTCTGCGAMFCRPCARGRCQKCHPREVPHSGRPGKGVDVSDEPVSPERLIQGYLSTIERLERALKREREDLRWAEEHMGKFEVERDDARTSLTTALSLLRQVEWHTWGDDGPLFETCPICEASKPGPHANDCRLASFLAQHPDKL